MGSSRKKQETEDVRYIPPKTPEDEENQLISLAIKQVRKQLEKGEASTQVLTHFLKLATVREQREREQLRLKNDLLEAQTEQARSSARSEEKYEEVLRALRSYTGNSTEEDEIFDDH